MNLLPIFREVLADLGVECTQAEIHELVFEKIFDRLERNFPGDAPIGYTHLEFWVSHSEPHHP